MNNKLLLKRVENLEYDRKQLIKKNNSVQSELARKQDIVNDLQGKITSLNNKYLKIQSENKEFRINSMQSGMEVCSQKATISKLEDEKYSLSAELSEANRRLYDKEAEIRSLLCTIKELSLSVIDIAKTFLPKK